MKSHRFIFFLISIFLLSGCVQAVCEDGFYSVRAVLDGDTIVLTNAKNVRYLGIDTPELRKRIRDKWLWDPEPYAVEAFDLNRKLVEGKKVRLEFDKETADKYGRWLAYVFVDGKMVNEELLRQGYAAVYVRQPNTRYYDRLMVAEKQGKKDRVGLWSSVKANVR